MSVELHLSGIFGFLAVAITWIFGGITLYKARKYREKTLYYFFFSVIFLISPWYPSGLGYIYWLITQEAIAYPVYVLLGTIGVPIALYSWLQIYMPALHPKQKKLITIFTIAISIAFYIYVFIFLFAFGDPVESLIGIKRNVIDIDYKGFVLVFLAFSLVISTVTGNDFAVASFKTKNNPEIRWKGRFLILSFNLFAIGAIADGFLPLNLVTLVIFRIFLMLSSTFFYIGFILPDWFKRLIKLKNK